MDLSEDAEKYEDRGLHKCLVYRPKVDTKNLCFVAERKNRGRSLAINSKNFSTLLRQEMSPFKVTPSISTLSLLFAGAIT